MPTASCSSSGALVWFMECNDDASVNAGLVSSSSGGHTFCGPCKACIVESMLMLTQL